MQTLFRVKLPSSPLTLKFKLNKLKLALHGLILINCAWLSPPSGLQYCPGTHDKMA